MGLIWIQTQYTCLTNVSKFIATRESTNTHISDYKTGEALILSHHTDSTAGTTGENDTDGTPATSREGCSLKVSAFPLRGKARLSIEFIKFWRYLEVYKLYRVPAWWEPQNFINFTVESETTEAFTYTKTTSLRTDIHIDIDQNTENDIDTDTDTDINVETD